VNGFRVKPSFRDQYPGHYAGHVFLTGFDQLVGGVHQEGGKILDLGHINFSGVTLYQTVFVGFPGTEGRFFGDKKLLAPNMGAGIKV